jgi:hypothetical protein
MSDIAPVVQMFQSRIREKLPELADSTGAATPDGFGNFTLLDIPSPSSSSRVGVLYLGDCFEISFSVAEARGPAERQVIITDDLAGAVAAVVDFLRDIVTGRILVDVFRYRLLWFQPYHLAFFRESSRRPRRRIVRTLSWNGKDDHVG